MAGTDEIVDTIAGFALFADLSSPQLGGRKSLYSTSFFTEDEFWRIYNGEAYQKLKSKFDPQGAFRNLYQKAVLRH